MLQGTNNPAYQASCDASGQSDSHQPWQLVAMQEAADFSDSKEEAAERCSFVAKLLSGMLHPEVAQRMTAKQLAAQDWLSSVATQHLEPCPQFLKKVLQK